MWKPNGDFYIDETLENKSEVHCIGNRLRSIKDVGTGQHAQPTRTNRKEQKKLEEQEEEEQRKDERRGDY